jgi:membrane protein implicated in regulation of membrane protease activity
MSPVLLIVGIAWMYVVLMMSIAEAISPTGGVLGAFFTFMLYGLLPLGVVLYLLATPARRRTRKAAEAASAQPSPEPDGSRHAAGDTVAPE